MVDCILVVLTIWLSVQASDGYVSVLSYKDASVTLKCLLATKEFPRWIGLPDENTFYNHEGYKDFNHIGIPAEKIRRLDWAENKMNLIIYNVTLADSGEYSCEEGSKTQVVKLEVRVAPYPPQLVGTTTVDGMKVIPCIQDQNITITCISSGGYPEPYVDLYRETVNITSTRQMTIQKDNTTNVTITSVFTASRVFDGLNVTCKSSYDPPETPETTVAILYLALKPTSLQIAAVPSITEGSRLHLQCVSEGSRPEGNISWTFNNITGVESKYTLFNRNTNTYTVISNFTTRQLQREDNMKTATCNCLHEALSSQLSVNQTLRIQFQPLKVEITGNKVIEANGLNELQLECETGTANPAAKVAWFNGSSSLLNSSNVRTGQLFESTGYYGGKISKQTLTIIPTRLMDGNRIMCKGWNYMSSNRGVIKEIQLQLNYEPITVIMDGPDRTVTEGQSTVTLSCYAKSKPPAAFLWLKDGDTEPVMSVNGTTGDNRALYTIASVNRTHAGKYICMADNGIGSSHSASIHLTVHYPPDVTVSTKNATVNDTSVDIKCEAVGVPSKYAFRPWRQTWPGTDFIIRDTIYPSENILTILHPSYQDTGVYTCFAENGVSVWDTDTQLMSGSVYLLVESNPIVTMPTNEDDDAYAHKIPAKLGSQFTFNISFYSNSEDVQSKFYRLFNNTRVNVPISEEIYSTDVTLRVYKTAVQTKGKTLAISFTVREEDQFGLYNVDIINRFGTARVHLQIIPEETKGSRQAIDNSATAIAAGTTLSVLCLVVIGMAVIYRKRISRTLFKTSQQRLIEIGNYNTVELERPISEGIHKNLYQSIDGNFFSDNEVPVNDVSAETRFLETEEPVLSCCSNEGRIPVSNLWDYVKSVSTNYFEKLHQEYWNLPSGIVYDSVEAGRACNSTKNRYRDILAYDHSRVILERVNPNDSNYINASYIDGYNKEKKFIASQGPTTEMLDDFWEMVVQENTTVIVMLTNLVENGARKCLQYWPENGEERTFGTVTVSASETKTFPDYVIREFDITKVFLPRVS